MSKARYLVSNATLNLPLFKRLVHCESPCERGSRVATSDAVSVSAFGCCPLTPAQVTTAPRQPMTQVVDPPTWDPCSLVSSQPGVGYTGISALREHDCPIAASVSDEAAVPLERQNAESGFPPAHDAFTRGESAQLDHTDGGALVMAAYQHPSADGARERLKRAYAANVTLPRRTGDGSLQRRKAV